MHDKNMLEYLAIITVQFWIDKRINMLYNLRKFNLLVSFKLTARDIGSMVTHGAISGKKCYTKLDASVFRIVIG